MLDLAPILAADAIQVTPGAGVAVGGALGFVLVALKIGDRLWRNSGKSPPATPEGNAERLDKLLAVLDTRDCPAYHNKLAESVGKLAETVGTLAHTTETSLELARLRHEQTTKQLDRIEQHQERPRPNPQT